MRNDPAKEQPYDTEAATVPAAPCPTTPFGMVYQDMRVVYDDGEGFVWLVPDTPDALPPARPW